MGEISFEVGRDILNSMWCWPSPNPLPYNLFPTQPQILGRRCHAANSDGVETVQLCRVRLTASYSSSTGDLSVNSVPYSALIRAYLSPHTQILLDVSSHPHCLSLITKAEKESVPFRSRIDSPQSRLKMKKFSFRSFRPSKGTLLTFVYCGSARHQSSTCCYLHFNS